jgi:hypothetical protein
VSSQSPWEVWFAWRPVRTDCGWRWLVNVRRSWWSGVWASQGGWDYEAVQK